MDSSTPSPQRLWPYAVLSIALVGLYVTMANLPWISSTELHTLMEVASTLLALVVGIIALIHYYSKRGNQLLFIGSAFVGTAMLDGYHMIVTSSTVANSFSSLWPSAPPSLIPWSWTASRLFLSLMLLLSHEMQAREDRRGDTGRIRPHFAYGLTGLLTLTSFLFFMFYPLPVSFYKESIFGRPEEFLAAALFGLALLGYWRRGKWRHESFQSWMITALIVSVFTQALFMPRSFQIHDNMFDIAHALKIISYALVFIGLLIDIYHTYNKAELTTKLTEMYDTLNHEVTLRREADKKLTDINLTLEQRVHDRTLELEQNQQELRAANTELEKIMVTLDEHSIVSMANTQGDITFVNDKFCEVSGYTRNELIGQNHAIVQSGEHTQEFYRNMWSTISGGDTWQGIFKNNSKNGTPYWVDATIAPFRSHDGRIEKYVAIRTDITPLMQQDQQLRNINSELEKLKITLDEHSIVSMANTQGDITFVNDKFCEISGYTRDELIGQNHSIIQSGEHTVTFYKDMWDTITAGNTWQGVIKNKTKDGHPYWVNATIAPFFTTDGRIEKYVAIRTDITPLMLQGEELRKQRSELLQVNTQVNISNKKLATTNRELDQFVHTASHDLKSPLVTILGYIGHLRHDVDAQRTDRIHKFTDRIQNAAQRMRQHIDDLLELSRVGKMSQGSENIDMNTLVREVCLPLAEQKTPPIQLLIEDTIPPVYADQALMIQIIDNLFTNALKYGCSNPNPTITIGGNLSGSEAQFYVRDNGPGIEPTYHEKVFGLFQRLSTNGDGTGVGLALVKRAVEVFGGRTWIESKHNEGACFWFTVPIIQPPKNTQANSNAKATS